MDGTFVPNISFGPGWIKSLRPHVDMIFDAHLMVEEPDRFLPAFAEAGCTICTVHAEACKHLDRTLHLIQDLGMQPGVALNPATPLCALENVADLVDLVPVSYTHLDVYKRQVLQARPDSRYHKKAQDIPTLAKLSYRLLDAAAGYVRPGGYICYSTCTITEEENQGNLSRFLEQHPDFQLAPMTEVAPATV